MPPDSRPGRALRVARRALALRCPRCGEAGLFEGRFRMRAACPACRLVFERAPGYFVGAIYVNYAVTAGLAVGGFLVLWAGFGLPPVWQLALWGPFAVLFPLWFFPWSRSLWLALEYLLNPEP